MDVLLQLLGSIASLFSVPLAIYFYLRSREAQLRRVREDIARSLSYQIGDGRELSTFEIQAVIDSQSRENRIRKGKIPKDDIVEDLVADTIRNPMIPSGRKQEIIDNLRVVHSRNIRAASQTQIVPADGDLDSAERHRPIARKTDVPFLLQPSNFFFFTLINLMWGVVAVIYFFFPAFWQESFEWPLRKQWAFALFVSGACSLVAAGMTLGFRIINLRRPSPTQDLAE